MNALETPVPLLQHPQEFEQLLNLYRITQPQRVLEIGTYHGGSLYHWLQNAPAGATVVSVDNHATGVDNSALYPEWGDPNVGRIVVIAGDSNNPDTASKAAQYGPYDWIYIDADHTLAAVTQDWQLYHPLAAPGAYIVLHDISASNDATLQVAPLWQQLKTEHDTVEFVTDGGWGIGVVLMP